MTSSTFSRISSWRLPRFGSGWIGAILLAGLAALAPAGHAQSDPEPWPREAQAPLVPDPTVTWGRLDNGMRYAIMPNRTPPGRVSLRLLIEAGSLMEDDDQRGLAHFLEHMAFKGSENVPPGEFVRYLQRQGMSFGADTNARTGFDSTVYVLELPGNTPKLVDDGLLMLSEVAGRLSLLPAEIEAERGVILSEKRLRNTPSARSTDAMLEFMLDGTLYPERIPIGTEQVIKTAGREEFERFYRDFYTPERSVVVVVGDIDPDMVEPIVEKHFEDLKQPAEPASGPELGAVAATEADALYFQDAGLPTGIALMHSRPAGPPADSLDRVDQRLVQAIAQLMLSRRLQSLSLAEDSAFSQAGAWTTRVPPVAEISTLRLRTTSERWKEALAAGEQELRRALEHGFSTQEMEEAIAILRSEFQARAAAAATMSSAEKAEALVSTVQEDEVFTDIAADLDLFERTAAALTTDKLAASLRDAWGTGEVRVMLSGSFPLEDAKQQILDAYHESRAVEVEPREERAVVPFAYQDFGTASEVVAQERIEDLGIVSSRFGNGVQLDVKPTELEADTIEVAVRFGAGKLAMPKDQPGLNLLASMGFVAGGLGQHDADQLNRIFADKQVGVDLVAAETSFVLTGTTTPEDLPDQLRLMAAYLTDPGFRPDALARFRRQVPDLYRSLAASPGGAMEGPVALLIHDGDPRFGLPPQEEMARRTLDELRAWMEPGMRTGPLQVVLVGDVDLAAATDLVAQTFGSLPDRGEGEAVTPPVIRLPQRDEPVRFLHQGAADQAMSLVFWPTADSSDRQREAGLDILADILADRLLHAVRDGEGASYGPEAFNQSSLTLPGYGYLAAILDLRAEDALRLNKMTVAIAASLQEGIEEDDLRRALEPRLAQVEANRQSNRWWAFAVLLAMHQFPDRLDAARSARADLQAHTTESIQALARGYLAADRALRVLVLPDPAG
ncbi:M16 family metallopeptidase [Geminicoccus roseus]|uniref:M16 family metallopeptidase n=1 Tax=Geminicoccus roseus TaxID=404900 RepID=UPI000401369B|nr:M16 family metallopeptidase [Geminicoccus roseus]